MDFAVAAGTQKQIIESLEQILLKIRRFEDPAWIDADAKNAAKDILDKQEKLKEKVEAGELEKEENVESLVEEQSMVREQLERLKSSLANNEAAMELAERAAEAASEAREAIFESESAEAIELQEEVIGSLAELTHELENDPAAQRPELSSEEFQKLAEALADTQEKLDQALELNEQATVQAAESKPEAAKTEQEAESKVAEASNPDTLPESVNQAIEEAKQEVAEAKESLMNDSENQDAAMAQLDEADQAIREAIGETEVALEEAMKNALAAKIGELNRAVEALERSASKSREAAAELNEQGAPSKEQVEQAKEDFNKIASIAQDVAEGIKPLSQESVDGLEQAAEQAQDLANSIPKSAGNETAENEAADQANAVADMLENAADELRKEMVATAEDLVNEIKGQLSETTELKNEVAMANNPEHPSDANALENLADQALQELPNVGKALQEAAEAAAQSEEGNETAGEPSGEKSGEQSGEPSGEGTPQPPTGDKPKPGQANPSPDSEPGSAGDMGESAESEGSPPVDPETQKNRQMLRAEVLADIDEERLEEELAAAEALKALTEQGRQSAEQIAQSREAMATEPGSPQGENSAEQVASSESPAGTPSESSGSPSESPQGTPSGEGNAPPSGQGESGQPAESLAGEAPLSPAQQELQEAVFDQAEALAGIGALAEALTEQSGIANEPIREAAQLASTLEPMEAEPLAATPAEGAAGDAGEAPMTAALPATGSPLLDPGGFVPNAPLQTAQMMAGQNVPLPSESQMAESGMPMGSDSSGLPSDSPMPGSESGQPGSQPGQPSPMATFANAAATGGGTSKGKQGLSENQAPKEGVPQVVEAQTDADSRVPGGRNGDVKTQQQPVEKSPFFTSLPKSVREAINSRGNRKLPRGYEERLKKYFKNIK
jgi:tetratricopeptide (TPR) repeat protein